MKQILIIITLLFPLFSICQETYFKFFPSEVTDEVICVDEDQDNNFFLGGLRYINGEAKSYLLKIDKEGNKVKDFTASNNNQSCSPYIFCAGPNRVLAVGYSDSVTSTGLLSRICVWEYDSNFNLISRNCCTFGENVRQFPQECLLLNDSVMYIGSVVAPEDDPNLHLSILKIGLPFDSLAYFQSPLTGVQTISDLIYNEIDSTLIVSYGGSPFKGTSYAKIIKLDHNLNHLSSYEPLVFFLINSSLLNFTDTSFLITSSTTNWEIRHEHLITAEYSYDFNLINTIEIPNGNADTAMTCGDAKNTMVTDSIIYTVGTYHFVAYQYPWQHDPSWILINRISKNFELIDQHFYGGDAFYMPYDMKGTKDGNVMVIGSRYDSQAWPHLYQKDIFVLCVNNEGLIVNIDQPTAPKAQEAIVFPNPGSNYLQVKLAVQHKNAIIRLFDTNGRAMLEKEVSCDEERVSTTHLRTGTYIYSITAKGKVIGQGKWIKN
ncbi:MAG: T9SS type A sorting domain-containing protein [Lentimicrobium sp.]|nr:T9SS type A sorting domain-containing protein [Lentimicrobium sp.]